MTPRNKKLPYGEDLFEDTKMTFGEHLDELRRCLVKAILGLLLTFVVVLVVDLPSSTIKFIEGPLQKALEQFYLNRADKWIQQELDSLAAQGAVVPPPMEVRDAIFKDKFLPQLLWLNPRSTSDDLHLLFPETFARLKFADFSAADFLDPVLFCQQVLQDNEAAGATPGKRIWELLDEPSRQLIQKWGAASDAPPGPMPRAEAQQLAAALSAAVVERTDFYRPDDFASLEADRPLLVQLTASQALAQERADRYAELLRYRDAQPQSSSPQFQRWFNRTLLAVAYPQAIAYGMRMTNMVPVIVWRAVKDDPRMSIQTLSAQEGFMIWLKAAFLLALVFASPWVFYQIWSFVAAGLYPHEKRYVHVFLPFSVLLFLAGAALCFFFVFDFVLNFLFLFNDWMDIDPDIRISEWFGFALLLPIGFGVSFQLPLAMLFLERIGVFTVKGYLSKWRVAILVIFVIAMLLTPADPYSMLLMAVPLCFLYFGGIALCRWLPRSRNPFGEVEETA
jgi:sec-independent protein translocase protein TatC